METTYAEFMEAKVKSWKDMKDRNVLKAAEKFKKKIKKKNIQFGKPNFANEWSEISGSTPGEQTTLGTFI